ncbi:MAG: hypothetical protein OEW48_14290 [Phycisphaerae bacterium]|nr:hypothetical protein [Phycisphaerae bacterium]
MAEKSEDKCVIEWSSGKHTFTLKIDDQYLVQEWKHGADASRRHWQLKHLSPKIDYSRGREKDCFRFWIATVITLALAASLFFSSINRHIPLLSPLIALIGLHLMGKAIRRSKVKTWTVIQKDNGKCAAYITHGGCSEEEINRFTECFVYAVEKAKKESIQNKSLESDTG